MFSLAYKNKTWIVKQFEEEKVFWTAYCSDLKTALGIIKKGKKEELLKRKFFHTKNACK